MAEEPAAPTRDGGLVRVRLDIAYDGTDFAGWAVQPLADEDPTLGVAPLMRAALRTLAK